MTRKKFVVTLEHPHLNPVAIKEILLADFYQVGVAEVSSAKLAKVSAIVNLDAPEPQPQEMYSPQESAKREAQIGKWLVKINGDMIYDGGRYSIAGDRLTEDNWIAHLFEKGWIDFNEFIPAYFQALKNIGKQFIKTRVFY